MKKPPPHKLECPKCNYSKVVRPQSDALNILDFIQNCPKCGTGMEKKEYKEYSLLDKIFGR